jgi:hypothetical protein
MHTIAQSAAKPVGKGKMRAGVLISGSGDQVESNSSRFSSTMHVKYSNTKGTGSACRSWTKKPRLGFVDGDGH